jgi:hypothetical protein
MPKRFLIGLDIPDKLFEFENDSLTIKPFNKEFAELYLIDRLVDPDLYAQNFCIIAAILLNQPIFIRAKFENSKDQYRLETNYSDWHSPLTIPAGPGAIFKNFNKTFNTEFNLLSEFLNNFPLKRDDFLFFQNTLVLRNDILLGFSVQVLFLERLVTQLADREKIHIELKEDQKSPSLNQKIKAVLQHFQMFPFSPKLSKDRQLEHIKAITKIPKARNALFHGVHLEVSTDVSRWVYEINRRLLMAAYGSKSSIVTNNWSTIGQMYVE